MADQRFQQGNTPDSEHLKMQAKQAFDAVLKIAGQAREAAGRLVHDNRGKIDSVLDKAAHLVDDRTGRRYASTIAKVKAGAAKGVDLVEGRPASQASGTTTGGTTPGQGPTVTVPGQTGPAASWPTGPEAGMPGAGPGAEAPGAPAAGWRRDEKGDWVRDGQA